MGLKISDGFVGTNDKFVLFEVIQPFMYDVFGLEYKKDINPDYSASNTIDKFKAGVEKIRDDGFMCKYNDNHNNFAFQLGLAILKKSLAARRFLKSKYYRIYIDEYQDSDVDMHNFFMYLCDDLKIPLFIVGDVKQSIYGWRGAYSNGFKSLFKREDFTLFVLWHNFRSNIPIQNYSNIFLKSVRKNYTKVRMTNEVIMYKYSSDQVACMYIKDWIDDEKKCAFLSYRKDDAVRWSNLLQNIGLNFQYIPISPLDNTNLESEHIWVARGVASYILTTRYSEYDFKDEIPIPENFRISILKAKLSKIEDEVGNWEEFVNECKELYCYLGFIGDSEKINIEINTLVKTISNDEYISTYNMDRYKLTTCTIHSSKGLEFNQVIINAANYDFSKVDNKYLHYVAVSRPEERLLIIAEEGYNFDRYLGYIGKAVDLTSKTGFDIQINDVVHVENN